MKITHHKVIGDGWISQRISLMNTCWVAVSQSVNDLSKFEYVFKFWYIIDWLTAASSQVLFSTYPF